MKVPPRTAPRRAFTDGFRPPEPVAVTLAGYRIGSQISQQADSDPTILNLCTPAAGQQPLKPGGLQVICGSTICLQKQRQRESHNQSVKTSRSRHEASHGMCRSACAGHCCASSWVLSPRYIPPRVLHRPATARYAAVARRTLGLHLNF